MIFALAVVVGVAVGLAIGLVVQRVRLRLDDPVVASAIGLLTPFAAYWGAEQLRGSGVLAVVTAGLYLGHTSPRAGYATRLYEEPIWSTVDLLLESFTFALIGDAAALGRPGRHRLRPGAAARRRAVRSACWSP